MDPVKDTIIFIELLIISYLLSRLEPKQCFKIVVGVTFTTSIIIAAYFLSALDLKHILKWLEVKF